MLKIERKTLKPSYVCGKSHREGRIKDDIRENYGCTPHRIFSEEVVGLVKRYIEKMLTDVSFHEQLCKELAHCPSAGDEMVRKIKCCEGKIAALQKKASDMYDDKLNGMIPDYLFKQKLEALSNDLFTYEEKLKEYEQSLKTVSGQTDTRYTIASIIKEIHRFGINHDTVSLLFKKILIFNPNEITDEQRAVYDLSADEYEHMKAEGGLLFVQNYNYHCNIKDYE